MAFAPTRSGKGVGLVVPTLLVLAGLRRRPRHQGRELAADRRLARHASRTACCSTRPMRSRPPTTRCWRCGAATHEVRDVQNIADILVDPEGALERRNHWEKTSHALLVGAILHVLYAGEDKTLRGVANFLSDPASPFELTLAPDDDHAAPRRWPASCRRFGRARSAEQERQRALGRAVHGHVVPRPVPRPHGGRSDARCDWRIADLIEAENPVSLYLVVPPSDISRTKPLIRLILNQIGRRLTESLDGSDGIAAPPQAAADARRVPGARGAWTSSRRPGLHGRLRPARFLIAQSPQPDRQGLRPEPRHPRQLPRARRRSPPTTNAPPSASRMRSGTATELRAQRNYAGHRLAPWLGHLMVSRQETARPLLTPGEVMQLPPDRIPGTAALTAGQYADVPPTTTRRLERSGDSRCAYRCPATQFSAAHGVGIGRRRRSHACSLS
jgi:type IV secretion system protein VirD4